MLIKKLLSKEEEDEIYEHVTSSFFPWNFSEYSVEKNLDLTYQFVHVLYSHNEYKSPFRKYLEWVINAYLKHHSCTILRVVRAKFNLLPKENYQKELANKSIHRDCTNDLKLDPNSKFITILYYVNDSDGDTILFDEQYNEIERFSPIKGNAIVFDSNILHRGSTPVIHKNRIILNIVLEVLD
jgi:hypothetical protein